MGIFGFRNKNDIVPKEKDLKNVVTKFNTVSSIKLNAKLVVPKGYLFVIGRKGKVTDKFEEGEHYLTFATLPVMCRKFHIDNSKKTKDKKEFPADFYFIKNDICVGKFETYRKVDMGTKAYGCFSTKVYGVYSYKISDVKEFMQSLLNEYDYIKTGEAEKLLESWVNEAVVKELENQNFILPDVIENKPIIANTLKLKLSKLFSVAGLELLEFKITKYKLPKKYQQDSDKNIAKQDTENIKEEQTIKDSEVKNDAQIFNDEFEQRHEEDKSKEIFTQEEQEIKKQQYYEINPIDKDIANAKELLKAFGIEKDLKVKDNISTEEIDVTNNQTKQDEMIIKSENDEVYNLKEKNDLKQNDIKIESKLIEDVEKIENENMKDEQITYLDQNQIIQQNEQEYVPFGNFVFEQNTNEEIKNKAKEKAKEKTFVDLSLNELYTKDASSKRCLNCGTENHIDADHCLLCGEKFKKGEDL